jgi:prepilin-type N-terminal cleavage/methylation domain-containing protein
MHRWVSQRGFSMIEVLVGISFLSISSVALTSLSLGTIKATQESRRISAATNLARAKIEELRGIDYQDIASGVDAAKLSEDNHTGSAAAIFQRTWTTTAGPVAGTKHVAVTVTWTGGGDKKITLESNFGE